jgi:hypothetical protein
MEVGCYSMDLYCDRNLPIWYDAAYPERKPGGPYHISEEFPAQFTGRTRAECRSQAREQGWRWMRDGSVICPRCASGGRSDLVEG